VTGAAFLEIGTMACMPYKADLRLTAIIWSKSSSSGRAPGGDGAPGVIDSTHPPGRKRAELVAQIFYVAAAVTSVTMVGRPRHTGWRPVGARETPRRQDDFIAAPANATAVAAPMPALAPVITITFEVIISSF